MLAFLKKTKVEQPKELINTCAKCSMEKFVECLVNGNTHVVGDWGAIFNEYLTLSSDTHIDAILHLMKSITMLENKLTLIQICIDMISSRHDEGLVENLKSFGFNFTYENGPQLRKELEMTVTQAKSLLIELNQDKKELEELRGDETKTATAQDYEIQYSAISEFLGVMVNPANYMVSRYCADIQRMKERYKPTTQQ